MSLRAPHVTRRRVALVLSGLVVIVLVMLVYVGIPVANDMLAARTVLTGPITGLETKEVEAAEDHLEDAHARLSGVPARLLRVVPIIGSNLDAVDVAADDLAPVLDAALELKGQASSLEKEGLLEEQRIRLDALDELRDPLNEQVRSLEQLQEEVTRRRNGWLAPFMWDILDDLLQRTREVRSDAAGLNRLLDVIDPLLGAGSERTYLILLINNAELRGAGGALTGAGTLTSRDGRLRLGRFYSLADLRTSPIRKVPAPPDYERRFGAFDANSTQWVNATLSPDISEVSVVTARLLEAVTGIKADGVIMVDPRGIAALMPPGATIEVPGRDEALTAAGLPGFVYSDAYEQFSDQARRRDALLEAGKSAFELILEQGFGGAASMESAGAAVQGGHLRVISFTDDEQAALEDVGVYDDLAPEASDSLLVTTQNYGGGGYTGSKLDYWMSRSVDHQCDLSSDPARCFTQVDLRNRTPEGLSSYVAGRPYGLSRTYLEIYVPESSTVTGVARDDELLDYREEREDGRLSLGVLLKIPRGTGTKVEVGYELEQPAEGYTLEATPQPLAKDADLRVALRLPSGWTVRGDAGSQTADLYTLEEAFDHTVVIKAGPDERTGIPALWNGLVRFWREPVF